MKRLFTTSPELTRLSEELKRQAALLQKQEDILKNFVKPSSLSVPPPPPVVKDAPKQKSPRGFLDFDRKLPETYRPAKERLRDWEELNPKRHVEPDFSKELKRQTARCMDCGTPYCQTQTFGCPLSNLIPEWNELVLTDRWEDAIERLHATNNFPEFTGRVCPAPCEGGCVAGLNGESVTIKNVEYAIVEHAFDKNWIQPRIPTRNAARSKKVAVIGSGPAGLACADTLNQMGHFVTVFEREDKVGGLLQYGIPTMKLSKETVSRRVGILEKEGIDFRVKTEIKSRDSLKEFDATVLCIGACKPRNLQVPGRDLKNIHFAMDFLTRSQKDLKVVDGCLKNRWTSELISVRGKRVVVIGGGDTGTDCIGTSLRQLCKSVVNLEVAPMPPPSRDIERNPWPTYPRILRFDYGHVEAKELSGRDPRSFASVTKRFLGDAEGNVRGVVVQQGDGKEVEIPCDVVILAMGFLGVEDSFKAAFHVEADPRGNLKTTAADPYQIDDSLFAAGDCRRGQSLVVWGIREGREAAVRVDRFLSKK